MQPVKPVDAEFDAYSADYDSHVNRALAFTGAKVDFFTRVKTEYLLDFMATRVPTLSDAAVLDVGCGTGNCHAALSGRLTRLCGIDVSASSIETAKGRNPAVDYAHYDGIHIPYPDSTFDFAFAICVFHHVPLGQRGPLIADIRRCLKPNGHFIIFEHNPSNPLTMRVINRCEFDRDAVLLKPRACEAMVQQGGFEKVNTQFILNVPALNAPLRTVDKWLSKLPLGAQYYTVGKKK
jgi:SAM-dependent methyltransferase